MDVDRQRVAAVRLLEVLGYAWRGGMWQPPASSSQWSWSEPDAMHAALVHRADGLAGCTEGSEQEAELRAITDVLERYEAKRWPEGKEPGGKG